MTEGSALEGLPIEAHGGGGDKWGVREYAIYLAGFSVLLLIVFGIVSVENWLKTEGYLSSDDCACPH